ncbi:PLP-dependent aminotransferase family protein [Candidatus Bipolaricaulota bacterium]|nr:PLP-dependent aminotransferase family protein [Candidatus Bipolaricaulota bacterium]
MTNLIALTRGVPASESFAIDALIGCAEQALKRYGTTILQYHPPRGFMPLREAIASQENVPVEQVMLGNGSIQLLDLLIRTTLHPGDAVLVERPTYDRTIRTFRNAGCQVHGIAMEQDGPNLHELEKALKRHQPRMLYVIPDFQNPTGATMSAIKREAVMALAASYRTIVIADLPYRPLRYWGEDEPSLDDCGDATLIRMSSFSKLISPGLRVGWMVAPESFIDDMSTLAGSAYICPSMVPEGMVFEFLRQGLMEPALVELKALYGPRLRACLEALNRHLPEAQWVKPEGGFFLGVTLPEGVDAGDVQQRARMEGVILSDGEDFYPDGDGSRFVRIPFCGVNERDMDTAITGIARAVRSLS